MGDDVDEEEAWLSQSDARRPGYQESLAAFRKGAKELTAFLDKWFAEQELMLAKAHKDRGLSAASKDSTDPAACADAGQLLPSQPMDSSWCCVIASPQSGDKRSNGQSLAHGRQSEALGRSGRRNHSAPGSTRNTDFRSTSSSSRDGSTNLSGPLPGGFMSKLKVPGTRSSAQSLSSWMSNRMSAFSGVTVASRNTAEIAEETGIQWSSAPREFEDERNRLKKAYSAARESRGRSMRSSQEGPEQSHPLRDLVQSQPFEYAIALMICISSLFVGWEVQHAAQASAESDFERVPEMPALFLVAQYVFSAIFTLELLTRACGQGFYTFFTKKTERVWNVYDLIIVISSHVEIIVTQAELQSKDVSSLLVTVRIFRISRIVRIIRFMPFIGKELRQMLYSMFFTIRSLVSASLIICMVFYVFGVIFTQATVDHLLNDASGRESLYTENLVEDFGTVFSTMYTLFLSISGGVTWGEPVSNLFNVGRFYIGLYVVFISFTLFAFLNVITGFFVDQAFDIAKIDKNQVIQDQIRNAETYASEFAKIFSDMDEDNSGDITIDELMVGVDRREVREYMQHLEIDVDKAWDLFRLLDEDGDGALCMKEFIRGCMKLRGPAKSTDIAGVRKDIKDLTKAVGKFIGFVHEAFDQQGYQIAEVSHFVHDELFDVARTTTGALQAEIPPYKGKAGGAASSEDQDHDLD